MVQVVAKPSITVYPIQGGFWRERKRMKGIVRSRGASSLLIHTYTQVHRRISTELFTKLVLSMPFQGRQSILKAQRETYWNTFYLFFIYVCRLVCDFFKALCKWREMVCVSSAVSLEHRHSSTIFIHLVSRPYQGRPEQLTWLDVCLRLHQQHPTRYSKLKLLVPLEILNLCATLPHIYSMHLNCSNNYSPQQSYSRLQGCRYWFMISEILNI